MSRKINMSGPLSDEDRAYLNSRGQGDIIAYLDYMARVTAAKGARESQDHRSFINKRSKDVLAPGRSVDGADDSVEEVDEPYHKWKKAELIEECTNRGILSEGTVPELAERLEADDENSV